MEVNKTSTIGRGDVIWNYIATFFQIGTGVLLLPLILKNFSSETVGVWTIFMNISGIVFLMDFGFNPSFVRNITYIFSGIQNLKKEGISTNVLEGEINFSLLKSLIETMKWIYAILAIVVFVLLASFGTWYLFNVTENYSGDLSDVYWSWIILIIINSYNLYTLYFDSLLQGKGLVKISKQIAVLGQVIYLVISIVLILFGYGLTAIVTAQLISIIVKRILSKKVFFTPFIKEKLKGSKVQDKKEIIKIILPNATKLGVTQLGAFAITKSSIFIGALYLTLDEIAQYGITMQVLAIIIAMAGVYYQTFVPKIVALQTKDNKIAIKRIFFKSAIIQFIILAVGGGFFMFFGNYVLSFIGSSTTFLSLNLICLMLIISILEKNHSLAAGFLLAKNEVPFFKASILSGIGTVVLLWFFLDIIKLGVLGLILAPGLAQLIYQNWKWPLVLIKQLK